MTGPITARNVYASLKAALPRPAGFVLVGRPATLARLRGLPAAACLRRPVSVKAFRETLHRVPFQETVREDVLPQPSQRTAR